MITILAPDVGFIVGCWFPYDSNPPTPGPDFRPCLVLRVIKRIDRNAPDIVVCYGTGQTTDCNKISMSSSSIEIEKGDGNNLAETTKFNLKQVTTLPFESRFFSPKGMPNIPVAKFGKLTKNQEELVVELLTKNNILGSSSSQQKICIIEKKSSSTK